MELKSQIDTVDHICCLIEEDKEYLGELIEYLPVLDQTVQNIIACAEDPQVPFIINEQYVLQILKDILYGIENQDSVILADVLRYGLLEVYNYGRDKLQGGETE